MRYLRFLACVSITLTVATTFIGCQAPFASSHVRQVLFDSVPARIEQRITQEIEKQQMVGLSVGLHVRGWKSATLHYGWEDREQEIPASDDTMYRWASISKPVTAILAMQLYNEGKLDLDRDVREYVSEFPAKPWPITPRQLLCHQGGVVHYTNGEVIPTIREYDVENPYQDTILALDKFKESPLVGEPGTRFSYTTHGYMLLGAVVQRSGNEAFASQAHNRVAAPLDMSSFQPDYQWIDIPHSTIGYRKNREGEVERSGDWDVSWKLPGGGFISNVRDLTRFGVGLLENKLVDSSTRAMMWTPQKTQDGETTLYGLGFLTLMIDHRRVAAHRGYQQKTATLLMMDPEKNIVIALMCNTEGSRLAGLATDLLRILVDEYRY